jgi:hypothetical protein
LRPGIFIGAIINAELVSEKNPAGKTGQPHEAAL